MKMSKTGKEIHFCVRGMELLGKISMSYSNTFGDAVVPHTHTEPPFIGLHHVNKSVFYLPDRSIYRSRLPVILYILFTRGASG